MSMETHEDRVDLSGDQTGEVNVAGSGSRYLWRTLKDSAIILPATIVQGLGGIAVTAIVSKLSSPAEFGNYTLGVALATALAMVAGQWFNESLIRLVPEYEAGHRRRQLYASLLFSVAFSALVLLAVSSFALFGFRARLDERVFAYLALATISFPLLVIFGGIQSWTRATGRSAAYSAISIWRIVGAVALGLVFVLAFDSGAIGFLWGIVLSWAIVAVGFAATQLKLLRGTLLPRNFHRQMMMDALRYSLPLSGIVISELVLSISDRYLVAGFLSSYAVGIYALGYSIAQRGMELVTGTFSRAAQPIIFRAWTEQGREDTRELIERLSRYYSLAIIPLATGITLLAREVVILFSTVEYADGAQVIGIVCAAMVCYGYARILGLPFALTKRTSPLLTMYLVTTLFNIVVNVIWIPKFGYIVAAWSTLASYALMLALTGFWSRRELPLRLFGVWLWKPVAASAGMAFVVSRLGELVGDGILSLLIQVGAGMVTYCVLIVAVRGLTLNEIGSLVRRVRVGWE